MGKLYKPLDFYMLRSPTYSMNYFKEITSFGTEEETVDYILNNILTNKTIIEMIIIASPKLYEALIRLKNDPNTKKKEQIILNLTKYLIRMSTRGTPFGLFSGVSIGSFDNNTSVQIENVDYFRKKARPDMQWLLGLIKKIESDINNVMALKVTVNHLSYINGSRANLIYNTQYGERSQKKEKEVLASSIKYNEVVEKIFKTAQQPIVFSSLINSIKNEYPQVAEDRIVQFIWSLFENEYLISELRPVLTTGNPFEYVINKLSRVETLNKYYIKLIELEKKIESYNELSIGKGKELLLEIFRDMKEIYKVSNPLQVDLSVKLKNNILNESIQKELAKVAEFLWILSPKDNINNALENYKRDFLEKYGEYREIPVLELLDPEIGLGSPGGYLNPISHKKIENPQIDYSNALETFLFEQISKASISKNEGIFEIDIEDERYEKFKNEIELKKAPMSLELYCTIAARKSSDIDKGKYKIQLVPNTGSDGAGKTFGRFINFFDSHYKEKIHKINELEKEFYEDAIIAEMVYLPDYGRAANVTIVDNIRDYELSIGTNSSKGEAKTLKMSDLVIGISKGIFYIRSKTLNKRVIITTGHMLNVAGCHNLCRLLKEISNDGIVPWRMPLFGWMSKMAFVPRINFGKVNIMPATWNLNLSMLEFNHATSLKGDFLRFKKEFDKWCIEFKVPRYVYLVDKDNRILLDRRNDLHLKIIQKELLSSTNKKVQFYEFGNELNEEWIEGDSGTYLSEVVVPFIKNKELVREESKINFSARNSSECDRIRDKVPGSDWLYFKIYCNSKVEDKLIGHELQSICNKAMLEGFADKYFYMRYADTQKHIRLRFNILDKEKFPRLISYIYEQCNELRKEGLISKVIVDVYEREVERYGGPKLIEDAERLFFYDSKFVQELLRLKEENVIKASFENICVFSILDYLQEFGITFEEQLTIMESVVNYKDYLSDFRKNREDLMNLCNKNNAIDFGITTNNTNLYKLLDDRKKMIQLYKEKMNILESKGELFNSPENIILSVIHLHCNRMIGIDRVYENKLNTLAYHTLKALSYFYNKVPVEI